MKYVFIIEGADKCGKSELCKHLIDKYKCNYIHNSKYREDPFRNYEFGLEILKTFEGSPSLVIDRYVLSNYVYSNVYQDGETPLPEKVWIAFKNHFDRVAHNHGYVPIWIVASPEYSVWEKTFKKSVDRGDEMYEGLEDMKRVRALMEEACGKNKLYSFDWTEDSDYALLDAFISSNPSVESPLNENTLQIADLMSYFRFLKDSEYPMTNGTYELLNYHFNFNPLVDIEFPGYKVNREYHKRELDWYLSLDRSIKGWMEDVTIWKNVASKDEKQEINSNYGWCVFSAENGSQFMYAIEALEKDPNTRQAQIIYTRPSMHTDWNEGGRHDFICTNTVQLFIRDNKLFYKIDQRSLDTTTGLRADWYWHEFVYRKALNELQTTYPDLQPGRILWNVGSCHIYERSFKALDNMTEVM